MAGNLKALIGRHGALRARLETTERALVIGRDVPFELPLFDATGENAEELRQALLDHTDGPFDLSAGPLFRAALLRVKEDQHLLILTGHHTVVNGATMALLVKELASLYSGFRAGRAPALGPAPSIADYQAWLAREEATPAWREQKEFWLRRLAGANPVLDLPLDRPRPARKTYRGARYARTMDGALYDSIRRVGQRENCTPFMALLAAYSALLHRWSGRENS